MIDLEDILGTFPLFSCLNKAGLKALSRIVDISDLKKDEVIYKEGASPDNLYIVISGRIKTYTENSLKEDRILEYLYKGTCFGIISLLTRQPHSVTAEVANDSLIVKIANEKFNAFLKENPLLALEFSKILSRRVKKRVNRGKDIFESLIISVYSPTSKIGKTRYSMSLAKSLKEESGKKVIAIELRNEKQAMSYFSPDKILNINEFNAANFDKFLSQRWGFDCISLYYDASSTQESKRIAFTLSLLTQIYNFIILDLPTKEDAYIAASLRQADTIHLVSKKEPAYQKRAERTIYALQSKYKIKTDKFKIILSQPRGEKSTTIANLIRSPFKQSSSDIDNIFASLPQSQEDIKQTIKNYPSTNYGKALRRIAREIAGVRMGLALGSGAAFGFAHAGVLKVLEENGVDIDIISGTSMGSIIATLWGLGLNWRQIHKQVHKFSHMPVFSFLDIGFSRKGFLKGRAFKKTLKDIFGNAYLYDLKRPALISSFDFTKRETHVLSREKLLIRKAVLASSSIPGIFAPLKNEESFLFDGGILNPLPVGCLVKAGVKKIISVNITPSKEEIRKTYAAGKNRKKLNVFDFIFGSIEAMQRKFIEEAASLSDIVIHPEFEDIMWTNFKKIDFFIEAGERAALKHIKAIKDLQSS